MTSFRTGTRQPYCALVRIATCVAISLAALFTVTQSTAVAQNRDARATISNAQLRALDAIDEYERSVFNSWPSQSIDLPNAGRLASGGSCNPTATSRCISGRTLPCVWGVNPGLHCAPPWQPTPLSNLEVGAAAERMLLTLAESQIAEPRNEWIASQRVFLANMLQRSAEAANAMSQCPDSIRCRLLQVLTLHRTNRTSDAERALDAAIAGMADRDRCQWGRVDALLDDATREQFRRLPCPSTERARFLKRFWHLSDPSWSHEGNDRRVEHYVREIEAVIQAEWLSMYSGKGHDGRPFAGTDSLAWILNGQADAFWAENRAVYVRPKSGPPLGLPEGARMKEAQGQPNCAPGEAVDFRSAMVNGRSVTMGWSDPPPLHSHACVRPIATLARYHFVPDANALLNPSLALPTDWDLGRGRIDSIRQVAPPLLSRSLPVRDEHFTPAYGATTDVIPGLQTARFRRGDSLLIAGASRAFSATANWRLIASSDTSLSSFTTSVLQSRDHEVSYGLLPAAAHSSMFAVEFSGNSTTTDPTRSRFVRTRAGLGAPLDTNSKLALSDMLMYGKHHGESTVPVDSATSVLEAILPDQRIAAVSGAGLYWETYGSASSSPARYVLTVRPIDNAGTLRTGLRTLFRRAGPSALTMQWLSNSRTTTRRADAPVPQTVLLNTSRIRAGEYEIELSATAGGATAISRKRVVIY